MDSALSIYTVYSTFEQKLARRRHKLALLVSGPSDKGIDNSVRPETTQAFGIRYLESTIGLCYVSAGPHAFSSLPYLISFVLVLLSSVSTMSLECFSVCWYLTLR